MSTPNQELVDIICKTLIESAVVSEKETASLKARILAGKIKPEDWNLAIENSLLKKAEEPTNDN